MFRNLFKKSETKINDTDTGLRGTVEGELYVDKKVFYSRPEVREAVLALKESNIIKEHIKASKVI